MLALLRSILNLARLLLLFLAFLLLYPFLKKRSVFLFLKFAGPSFIKLGQALSTRPDLVGRAMAETLSHFQDKLTPFSPKLVKKIMQRESGSDFSQKFVEFNFVAQASASIAQVHRAVILVDENGRENSANKFSQKSSSSATTGSAVRRKVAVKILRPRIKQIVARDIATLSLIAKLLQPFAKFTAKTLHDINLVLKESTKSELNLLKEAANAMRLKHNLQGLAAEGVLFYVPQIFLKYSTPNILVSEWIDGVPFSNQAAIHAAPFDKKQIARNLVISYFTQVYSDGFFHADMHPGNLFLMNKGAHAGAIAVVDFGIMGEIDKKMRIAVAEIFIGFLHEDYKKVAQLHIDAGLVPANTSVYDLALSCQKIGEIIGGSSVKEISLATLLTHLIAMTREYQMIARPELLLLQKTLLLVEGVGVMLDDELNIWDLARPWVKEWAKKNIGFDAKIRDALVDLFDAVRGAIKAHKGGV